MKKFGSWLAGIAATVIAAWLIYKIIPSNQPQQPTQAEIAFEGMVIDGDHNIPVKDALVSFQVDGASAADAYHDLTDEHGSYGLKLAGLNPKSNVLLHVHANGYHDESKQFTALIDDNRYDPILRALPTPPPPPPPHGATPTPTPVKVLIPPKYIQKLSIQTYKLAPFTQKK